MKREIEKKLFSKDFLLLLCGQTVSSAGSSIVYIGLIWWIIMNFPKSEGGIIMGTVLALNIVPKIVMGSFVGIWIDKFSRKFIVVSADILRGVINLIFAYLIFSNLMNPTYLYVLIVFSAIGSTFFNPAVRSSIPNIVSSQNLTRANGLYQGSLQIVNIVGPTIGGLLIAFIGIYPVFIINGISYLFSAFTELFINFKQEKIKEKRPFLKEFMEGFKFIYSQKIIFYLMIMSAVIGFFLAPMNILIAKRIKYFFNLGALELGYVTSAISLGMILGTFVISIVSPKKKFLPIVCGITTIGFMFSIVGYLSNFLEFLMGFFIIGFFASIVTILGEVVLQTMTPDEKRGRVFSISNTFDSVFEPVSLSAIGTLTSIFSTSTIFLISGIVIFLTGVSTFFVSQIKEI